MSEQDWWYSLGEKEHGPVPYAELERLYTTHRINAHTLVWHENMESWKPLGDVEELKLLSQNIPPPLPDKRSSSLADYPLAGAWKRFFARIVDLWWQMILLSLAFTFTFSALFPPFANWIMESQNANIFYLLIFPSAFVFDAAIHLFFGRSLGKAFLGLTVVDKDNKQLSFSQYLVRNMKIWMHGFGFGIPIVNLITMGIQHGRLKKGQPTNYDIYPTYFVRAKPIGVLRTMLFAIFFLSVFIGIILINAYEYEVDREYEEGQRLIESEQTMMWENSVTGVAADIAVMWTPEVQIDEMGNKIVIFSEPNNYAAVILAVEEMDSTLKKYIELFRYANEGGIKFNDQGSVTTTDGTQRWYVEGSSEYVLFPNKLTVDVRKYDKKFWRVVTIEAKGQTVSNLPVKELKGRLLETIR